MVSEWCIRRKPLPIAITLKNIPDDIYDRLKTAARAQHRSVNKEVIACLERAYLPSQPSVADRLARLRSLRSSLGPRKFNSRDILRATEGGRP